ncbi:3-hydroxyacyl-CoA dehydrogenase NAD-binding domain-containing protein [Paradesulfitobacterium ferrireducens]|uniref:3-hydroxyacyl-CoA dehydrogenase NAD-binding domain-containing protein n=1 Tax=Paradesulfitobacterium ferrireducens TaxID=2816476 RepID=UPI001A8E6238|nr:3-hydroxyacyl-CoA dehydrogenase NAD-binding domain-containing protein [Paradesulfitobacterium ferrireducens]
MPEIRTIAIIGAGTMGHSIAAVSLRAGLKVNLIDTSEAVLGTAGVKVRKLLSTHVNSEPHAALANPDAFRSRLYTYLSLEEGAAGADFVIEAVPEKLSLKQEIFKKLDALCPPDVVLASNTSGLPITSIAAGLQHPARVVGTHFYMPADIMPLVEVVRSDYSGQEAMDTTVNLLRFLKKKPVVVNKDIPGFIGNRLQHAIAREALFLLDQGVASARDIDDVVRYTLGLRFLHTGPLEQRDLNGLDIALNIAEYLYPALEDSKEPPAVLKEKVASGMLGLKTGRGLFDWSGTSQEEVIARKSEKLAKLLDLIE